MVELINVFGDDNMVVDVARVSFDKTAKEYSPEKNNKLIKYLAKHNHWSPFSHPKLQFRITCPIYIERQLFKHQVGVVVNSVSGRYVTFEKSFSKMEDWRYQSKNSKQGSEGSFDNDMQKIFSDKEKQVIEICSSAYDYFIEKGMSKEQARSILPLNLNTTFIMTCSLSAFIRICKQRIDDHAQKETRQVVELMLEQAKRTNLFNWSFEAYDL